MNLSSGVFTAPTAGIYLFTFSALKTYSSSAVNVFMRVNNVLLGSAFAPATQDQYTMSLSSTLKLKVGDRVALELGSGVIYGNDAHYGHFNGILLYEDLFA